MREGKVLFALFMGNDIPVDIQGGSVKAAEYIVLGSGEGSWLMIYEWTDSGTEGHLPEKEQLQEEENQGVWRPGDTHWGKKGC